MNGEESPRAVLFDADGVVQTSRPLVDEVARSLSVGTAEAASFLEELWSRLTEIDCIVGGGDLLAEVAALLAEHGFAHDAAVFYSGLSSATEPCDDVLALVDRLRENGVLCALATNQDPYNLQYMVEHFGYGQRFDSIYASCDLKVRKPTREFFEAVLVSVAMEPTEVLFLDDHPANVAGAIEVGIRAEHIVSPAAVAGALASYGLLGG